MAPELDPDGRTFGGGVEIICDLGRYSGEQANDSIELLLLKGWVGVLPEVADPKFPVEFGRASWRELDMCKFWSSDDVLSKDVLSCAWWGPDPCRLLPSDKNPKKKE